MTESISKPDTVLLFPSRHRRRASDIVRFPARFLLRSALQDLLGRALERRLLLMIAPRGYGKSIALAQAVTAQPLPLVWLNFAGGGITLNDVTQELPQQLEMISEIRRPDLQTISTAPESIAAFLLRSIRQVSSGQAQLVFDDFDRSSSPEETLRFIQYVIDFAPPGLHIAVAGAEHPKLGLLGLARVGGLAYVGARQLAFSEEEIGEYLRLALGTDVDDTFIKKAHEATAGRSGELEELVKTCQRKPESHEQYRILLRTRSFDGERGEGSVLEAKGLDRELLLAVAFLPTVDLESVRRLTGVEGTADRILAIAARSRDFQQTAKNTYVMESTVREALLSVAEEELADQRLVEYRVRVASILEDRGDLNGALRLYMEAAESEHAGRIVQTIGLRRIRWWSPTKLQSFAARIDVLPSRIPERYFIQALSEAFSGDDGACAEHCEIGIEKALEPDDKALFSILKIHALLISGLQQTIQDPLRWTSAREFGVEDEAWGRLWLAHGLLSRGRLADAGEQLERMDGVFQAPAMRFYAGWWALCQADRHIQQGLYSLDRESLDVSVQIGDPDDDYLTILRHRLMAQIALFQGDLEGAASRGEQALQLTSRFKSVRHKTSILLTLAEAALWRRDFHVCRRRLIEAEDLARSRDLLGGALGQALNYTRTRLFIATGASPEAAETIRKAVALQADSKFAELWCKLQAGYVLLKREETEAARRLTLDVLCAARSMDSRHLEANALLISGYLLFRGKEKGAISDYLTRFRDIISEMGYRVMPVSDGEMVEWATAVGAEGKPADEEAFSILAFPAALTPRIPAQQPPASTASWVFEIKTFGPLQLRVKGTTVPESIWKSRLKAKRLFELLLSKDSFRVSVDVAVEYFWADSQPGRGKHRLHNAVSDLRKVFFELDLKQEIKIVFEHSFYRLVLSDLVHIEHTLFQSMAEEGLSEAAQGNDLTAVPLLTRAVDVYHGIYLQDSLYDRFSDEKRQELIDQMGQVLRALASSPSIGSQESLTWWQQALEHDPYDEDAYRGAMAVCLELKESKKARTIASALKQHLVDELGMEIPEWAEHALID